MSILSKEERKQRQREAQQRYRLRYPDRIKEFRRRYYEEKHPGSARYGILTDQEKKIRVLENSKRHYQENKELYLQWHRNNYRKNKDKILTRNKAWASANPDKIRKLSLAGTNRRKVRQLNCKGSHTYEEWQDMIAKCEYKCVSCGKKKKLSKDHIVPLIRGGTDYIDNIQPLCRECNSAKRDRVINFMLDPKPGHVNFV
jgi:5-methylcytosine-specific restriction endonuclease McrA